MASICVCGLPPSTMSVPRPAMLVAIVIAPGPAGLGDDVRLALMLLGVQHLVRDLGADCSSFASRSEVSIEVVPTSTGWPRFTQSWMSSRIA